MYDGVTFGQKLLPSTSNIVGAWSHMPLPWPMPHELEGRVCWCGRNGCLEGVLSLRGLENEYFNLTQTKLDIQEIADAADPKEFLASSGFKVLNDRIGVATTTIINMFDPDVIILSGRIAELSRLYLNVPRKWPDYSLSQDGETKLRPARNVPFALAWGAAWLIASKRAIQGSRKARLFKFFYGQLGSVSASSLISSAMIVKSP